MRTKNHPLKVLLLIQISLGGLTFILLCFLSPPITEINNIVVSNEQNRPVGKKDWINYRYKEFERFRKGFGENGEGVTLTDGNEIKLRDTIVNEFSMNGVGSDKISMDRSLPDVRHEGCLFKQYDADLPLTSVIILFRNEYHSALKRTVHSVVNRTPKELLKEIILVDDCSTNKILKDELDQYMRNNFPKIVRILRLTERQGLMRARMAGIRNSTAEIVVVMDGHMEVNVNWLPPLIEPIAKNSRTMTQPFVDTIDSETLQYSRVSNADGDRDGFDWSLGWVKFARVLGEGEQGSDNYGNPVIMGAVFAINKEFFWEIGGFDPGLEVWGGEQFELSWKVWMCHGQVLTVPCSHIGHNYKNLGHHPYLYNQYVNQNLKRIIDVWCDEFKELFYDRRNLRNVNRGDISDQIALRNKLKCKSFKWYIETILPDMKDQFPYEMTTMKAYGTIQSVARPELCVDRIFGDSKNPIGIYKCDSNSLNPHTQQFFIMTKRNEIRFFHSPDCWDTNSWDQKDGKILTKVYGCYYAGGNQYYHYNMAKQQIIHGQDFCLELQIINSTHRDLYFTKCIDDNETQKWKWGFVNETLMKEN